MLFSLVIIKYEYATFMANLAACTKKKKKRKERKKSCMYRINIAMFGLYKW